MNASPLAHPLQWLSRHDPDLVALRRAGRTAIVLPSMFAICEEVIENPVMATFAAFGSVAMLLLVGFGGPMRERLQAQAALALVGGVFVCLGTLASQNVWLAAVAMGLVGFGVIFAGVVSSVLAGATTSLLLSFILPVATIGPISSIPDRLAGWGVASGAALIAVWVLWPAPVRGPLRSAAAGACRALAARLRAEVAYVMSGRETAFAADLDGAVAQAQESISTLHGRFLATPYRPTSLSTSARTIVRLVDELDWLNAIVIQSAAPVERGPADHAAGSVKVAAATVLERGAELLEATGGERQALRAALTDLEDALNGLEEGAMDRLPLGPVTAPSDGHGAGAGEQARSSELIVGELVTSLDPSFRAEELGFAVSTIAHNIDLTAAAEQRSLLDRALGHQPQGIPRTLTAAQQRATAHVARNSVWLHNSVRGGVGLGIAVFVANRTGVQHSFWVVLGALSVLRSNALSTGQTALRGLLGTVAGFVIGAALLEAIGTNATLLWFLLPVAILFAGVAPAAISFAAGQAAFTLTLVFLFNLVQPTGWRVGLLRVEDVALGCAVSLVVGLLFWPRGATAALRRALADAYTDSADYLARAVDFGMCCCDRDTSAASSSLAAPVEDAARAAGAARRLDDAFRAYMAERGAKPVPLAEMTSLVTGVGGLRLAADAVLGLWEHEDGSVGGDRASAREELLRSSELLKRWYEQLASSLLNDAQPPPPLPRDEVADGRLLAAVRRDLSGADGRAGATALRMIWTGDQLDAVRRLQEVIVGPAQVATGR
jgi:uncharacterized membrane protein YccC